MFQLYDIDKDGIPEAFISDGIGSMSTVSVYGFANGNLTTPKIPSTFGVLYYHEKLRQVAATSIQFGIFNIWVSDYKDGKFETCLNASGLVAPDAAGVTDATFKVNNKDVSKDEFNRNVSGYITSDYNLRSDWIQLGRQYKFSDENIKNAVYSWQ